MIIKFAEEKVGLEIRKAREVDISGIAALERECFSDPWSEESLCDTFGILTLIATDGSSLLGYIVTRCLAGEAELFRICVKSEARRQGIGRLLLERGLEAAAADGAEKMFLEVRSHNSPARALYAGVGFKEAGLRKNYYSEPEDDAIIMLREINCR